MFEEWEAWYSRPAVLKIDGQMIECRRTITINADEFAAMEYRWSRRVVRLAALSGALGLALGAFFMAALR